MTSLPPQLSLEPHLTDYKSVAEVKAALCRNADFRINDWNHPSDGKPVNLSQIKDEGVMKLSVRYAKQRKQAILSVDELHLD